MSHLKILTCKGTLRQVFILPEAQNPMPPSHLHTVYVNTVYLFTQGRGGGGELNQREGKMGNSSQNWIKNTNMIDCISSL